MAGVQDAFNSARFTLPSGKVVEATVYSSSYNGVDGSWLMTSLAPAAWSPESSTWVPLEESKINATLIADKAASCRRFGRAGTGEANREMHGARSWPSAARRCSPSASPCGGTWPSRSGGQIAQSRLRSSQPWLSTVQQAGRRSVPSTQSGAALDWATAIHRRQTRGGCSSPSECTRLLISATSAT